MQTRELLQSFGALKTLHIMSNSSNSNTITNANDDDDDDDDDDRDVTMSVLFSYMNVSVAESAVNGLCGLELGGQQLMVEKVPMEHVPLLLKHITNNNNNNSNSNASVSTAAATGAASDAVAVVVASRVLYLSDMVSVEELLDDEVYEELKEEVMEECVRVANVSSMQIPRPTTTTTTTTTGATAVANGGGVGGVFVEFATVADAEKAMKAFGGRTFDGKTIHAKFYDPILYQNNVSE